MGASESPWHSALATDTPDPDLRVSSAETGLASALWRVELEGCGAEDLEEAEVLEALAAHSQRVAA